MTTLPDTSDPDCVAFAPDGAKYRCPHLATVVISAVPHVAHVVEIPKDYRFDGASIPRCLWWLIGSPFDPELMLAACVHDWYCEHTSDCYQSRVIGDAVFFALLARAGVSRWRRVLMYLGVRLHSFWNYGRSPNSPTPSVHDPATLIASIGMGLIFALIVIAAMLACPGPQGELKPVPDPAFRESVRRFSPLPMESPE